MRRGQPLPDRIANAPEVLLGLELYWQAFWELNTCRPAGWGLAPIPWSVMNDYATTFDFDDDQRESLFDYIMRMDKAYRDHHAPPKPPKGKKGWQPPEG